MYDVQEMYLYQIYRFVHEWYLCFIQILNYQSEFGPSRYPGGGISFRRFDHNFLILLLSFTGKLRADDLQLSRAHQRWVVSP